MWMILHDQRPQWQSLQKESSSFKAHLSRQLLLSRPSSDERGKTAQRQFLSRPSGQIMSFNNKVSYIGNKASYMDTQSMMFDSPETRQTPPTSPAMSPPRHHSPRSPSYSPPASLPSRESSVEPSSEDSSPKGRKRHQSEPAFIRPHDVDQGLTPSLSALLAETSPLAPY